MIMSYLITIGLFVTCTAFSVIGMNTMKAADREHLSKIEQ